MTKRLHVPLLLFAALSAAAVHAGEDGADGAEKPKPVLVASTTQIADFARQIVGDRCVVKCILAPGADPHTYSPKPSDAETVGTADLCLQNGLHLEGKNWMGTLAEKAGKPIVTCTEGLEPLELVSGGQKIHDPHSWFSCENAALYVNNIAKAVLKLDPAGKEQYVARAQLYLKQLKVLDAWIREQFNAIAPERRILVTSHDAFNYFSKAYGFRNEAPVGWSTGSEVGGGMTPERRRKVVESIQSFGVRSIFVETSVNPKLIREIAREAGVEVGGMLYSDSMGAPGTAGETYVGMMRENVLTIVHALK